MSPVQSTKIILATVNEVDQIAPLFSQYRQFYKQASDLEGARKFIMDRISQQQSTIFLAIEEKAEGQAVGFVQLYPSFSSVSMQRTWILNDLYVTHEARNKKIGKQLLQRAKEFAQETKAKGIRLSTARDNLIAQKLYESVGYSKEEYFIDYFLDLKEE